MLWSLLTGITLAVHPTSASISEGHVEARYDSTLHVGLAGRLSYDPFIFGAAIGSDYASLRAWGMYDRRRPARGQWAMLLEVENTRYYAGPQDIKSRVHFISGGGAWVDRIVFEWTLVEKTRFHDPTRTAGAPRQVLTRQVITVYRNVGPGAIGLGVDEGGLHASLLLRL
jgi:hypothetical protein